MALQINVLMETDYFLEFLLQDYNFVSEKELVFYPQTILRNQFDSLTSLLQIVMKVKLNTR